MTHVRLPRCAWHLVFACSFAAMATAQSYTIRRLTAPGHSSGSANGIDNSFRIVGDMLSGGVQQPIVWVNGVATLPPIHAGGAEGTARAIDDSGRIGGWAASSSTVAMATAWEPGGPWTGFELGLIPNTVFSGVHAIAGGASAAGFADDGFVQFPIAWTSDADVGNPAILPTTATFPFGEAFDITASDLVVGYLANGATSQPVSWSKASAGWTVTPLPTLGGWGQVTTAINNTTFFGGSIHANGFMRFASWVNGAVIDLGALPNTDCFAMCANTAGETAGWCRTYSTPPYVAVHRPAGGTVTDLNSKLPPQSPWLLTSANGINDAGAIVGQGILNGFFEPFVMIPTSVNLATPVPGLANTNNKLTATGAATGNTVWFLVALAGGETPIPGCLQGLDIVNPLAIGTAIANGTGVASFTVFVPGFLTNIPLLFQAYDQGACRTSNVRPHTF